MLLATISDTPHCSSVLNLAPMGSISHHLRFVLCVVLHVRLVTVPLQIVPLAISIVHSTDISMITNVLRVVPLSLLTSALNARSVMPSVALAKIQPLSASHVTHLPN